MPRKTKGVVAENNATINLIINLIPQAVYAKDQNGRFIFANQSYASLYGLSPEQMVGKTIAEIIPPGNDIESFLSQDEQTILSGETLTIPELIFKDHKGVLQKFHTTKLPYLTSENEKGVLGIGHNITEQVKSDFERKKIIADIIQRNTALEHFSYIISHNLRSPVANIIGINDALKNSAQTEDEKEYLLNALYYSVEKLDNVIQDINKILDFKNQTNQEREMVSFSQVVSDIETGVRNAQKIEDFEIITDFSEIGEILTLKSCLHNIFSNIISNSIKYRQPDLKPVVKIETKKTEKTVEVVFIDNGLGFDVNAHRENLFRLYKRFHTHVEGKGMGLFIVKTQVEALGGRVGINSVPNKGTKIKIELEIH
jgi:PAS domain S-box-containing protein